MKREEREEAIKILKEERSLHLNAIVREALSMAIAALKAEPCEDKEKKEGEKV